ncbi:hypothetical protein B1A87_005240 [Arthrobacter sp. KBS0703]|uniref:hypothetical protein n=1 Tax=Arthrobacter sp. KBS0703 TaxID=1955698 RepID=UPI001116C08E|nr:hypothetical protein [Arthrobacter sp. KBS0703]TSE15401.1 hypothetical protein B1A87_005240 [Arthrobacter sp. KBS0703]
MPSLVHNPLNIKNAIVSIDGVEYSDAITLAKLSNTFDTAVWSPVSGNVQQTVSPLVWTCDLEFGQDFTANTTLTAKLIAFHGLTKTVIIKPTGTATQSWTFTATITAPKEIGGGTGVATTSASLPVSGQPTLVYGV